MDQLKEYREERKKKYYIQKRIKELSLKYKNKIILDPIKRSASRINNFIKKYVLFNVDNADYIDLKKIPSIFIIRLVFTEENLIIPEDRKKEKKFKKKNENKYHNIGDYNDQIVQAMKTSLDEYESSNNLYNYDDVYMNNAILESLNDIGSNYKEQEQEHVDYESIDIDIKEDIKYKFAFDLRIIITNLLFPISWNNYIFYFTDKQIEYIKKIWNKVDPSTNNGILFSQKLEYDKGLVKDRLNRV